MTTPFQAVAVTVADPPTARRLSLAGANRVENSEERSGTPPVRRDVTNRGRRTYRSFRPAPALVLPEAAVNALLVVATSPAVATVAAACLLVRRTLERSLSTSLYGGSGRIREIGELVALRVY